MQKYSFITLLVVMAFGLAYQASALALAPFPSSTKLQPIPAYVQPNVSGNVNATLSPSYDTSIAPDQAQQTNETQTGVSVPTGDQTLPGNTYFPWIIGGTIFLLLILSFLLLFWNF